MPLYKWRCQICSHVAEVLRSLPDYEQAPTTAETPDCELLSEHSWERLIQTPLLIGKGPNWGGGKGNW